jgi:hypothetical protein
MMDKYTPIHAGECLIDNRYGLYYLALDVDGRMDKVEETLHLKHAADRVQWAIQQDVLRQSIDQAERKAFAAGQEWIWADLEQTERVPKYDTFEEWKVAP